MMETTTPKTIDEMRDDVVASLVTVRENLLSEIINLTPLELIDRAIVDVCRVHGEHFVLNSAMHCGPIGEDIEICGMADYYLDKVNS